MGNTFYFQWEVNFMEWLQSVLPQFGIKIAYYLSMFGEELLLILIMGYIYWCYDKKIGFRVGLNIMVSCLVFPIIKNMAIRRRPYMDNPTIKCFKPVDSSADSMDINAQGYSFPSGHSESAMTIYGSLWYFFRKNIFKVLAIVLPILVGFSRVALGNHYPTDVLAGWLVGILVIFLVPKVIEKVTNKKLAYLGIAIVASCGMIFCNSNDYFTALGMIYGLFLGNLFEEKYVNFENTKSVKKSILRVLGGIAIYFVINTLMKLPFSEEFLSSQTFLQHIYRTFRYTIILILETGIYPKIFDKCKFLNK